MRFVHISDLHLGKRVNGFSMIEDQEFILTKIINIIDEEKAEGVLIAGDIYDKSIPSEDAIKLWDEFINKLANRKIPVFIISGNHDSAIRLAEHNELVRMAGVHLSPMYDGNINPYTFEDKYGKLNIYMLPFIKPVTVRQVFPDEDIKDYTDACRVAIRHMHINQDERNILVAHQFVTGATTCDSEDISVGGLDNVDVTVFDEFDYVALGHIHGPQQIGRETVRYSGTPLKYSFSEINHKKSVTVIEMEEKGNIKIRTIGLKPKHEMRRVEGKYEEITDKRFYENTDVLDYLHIVLKDEEDIFEAIGKLRVIYPNIMKISYDNKRTRENKTINGVKDIEKKSQLEHFEEFYELQNNQPMSAEQKEFCMKIIKDIWEI